MSQATRSTISAHQIASRIDNHMNGFSSMAQAFIDVISEYEIPDPAAIQLYKDTLDLKQAHSGSSWLLSA